MRRSLPTLLVALVLPLAAAAQLDCRAPEADCSLREAAAQAGVLIGAAVRDVADSDPLYEPALAADFDSVTHEHAMKWNITQPTRGVFSFDGADALVDFAEANGMSVRGHTLIWEQAVVDATPDYVTAITDPADLRALVTAHIQTVVGRYRGRVDAWDVVNEPLETLGSAVHENVFHRVLGPGYIAEVFHLAHAADPDALLFLNEIVLEPTGPKLDALVALTRDLLEQGVPVHGVGVQGHYFIAPEPARIQASLQALADLGVVVELTEVDVLLRGDGDLAARLERQRRDYFGVAAACLAVPGCRRITLWGLTDRHTWIDDFVGPGRAPLPLDADYQRKPAWYGLRDGLLSTTHPLPGKQLVARQNSGKPGRNRLVVQTKSGDVAAAGAGSAGDPTLHGGTLAIDWASGGALWDLPAEGWTPLRRGRGWRYAGASGPVRSAVLKDGRALRILVRGADIGLDLASDPAPVTATLSTGTRSHCLRFSEAQRLRAGKSLRATKAPAPATCPAPRLAGD